MLIVLFTLTYALQTRAATCCDKIYGALSTQAFSTSSVQYAQLNSNRWSDTSILSPACIVTPSTADDVSKLLKILVAGARQNATGCSFAIKSGGHNPNPGANNINGGVTIDLKNLNSINVSPNRALIRLGVGSTWQRAYDTVPDLLFPGGLCGDTGVGGVTLGGGMSLLFAKVGWVVDQITEFELVLANGTITVASRNHNPDLYRALKGGGSNFGILTAITVKVYAQRRSIFAGQIYNAATPNATSATAKAMTDYTAANNNATSVGVQCAFLYGSDGKAIIEHFIGDTDDVEGSPALKPFFSLPDQVAVKTSHANMSVVAEAASDVQPHGWRDLTATLTFENSVQAMSAVQSTSLQAFLSVNGTVPNMDYIIFYIPMPRVIVTAGQSTSSSGNVLGLDSNKDRISVSLNPRWKDPAYDNVMHQSARTWVSQTEQALKRINKLDPFLYLNYAAAWQKPFESYGTQNLNFLRRTAATYDPNGIFQRQMPGTFHLF